MSNNIFGHLLASDEFKEESFVAETQAQLSRLLDDKGVSRAELARRLNVSRARITQIFSDEAQNLTLRLLVRSYLALGEEPVVLSRSEYEQLQCAAENVAVQKVESGSSVDGIAEALIAKLLQANIGEGLEVADRFSKVSAKTEDWVSAGSNVVPLRRAANG